MLECCRQDTKEAMICIDNKYVLIKFTYIYQINHNFSYFSTKALNIELGSSAVADIAHFDARCSIIILRKNLK